MRVCIDHPAPRACRSPDGAPATCVGDCELEHLEHLESLTPARGVLYSYYVRLFRSFDTSALLEVSVFFLTSLASSRALRGTPTPDSKGSDMTTAQAMETGTSTSGTAKPATKKCNTKLWTGLAIFSCVGGTVVRARSEP